VIASSSERGWQLILPEAGTTPYGASRYDSLRTGCELVNSQAPDEVASIQPVAL
jgi:hypothetical protein